MHSIPCISIPFFGRYRHTCTNWWGCVLKWECMGRSSLGPKVTRKSWLFMHNSPWISFPFFAHTYRHTCHNSYIHFLIHTCIDITCTYVHAYYVSINYIHIICQCKCIHAHAHYKMLIHANAQYMSMPVHSCTCTYTRIHITRHAHAHTLAHIYIHAHLSNLIFCPFLYLTMLH